MHKNPSSNNCYQGDVSNYPKPQDHSLFLGALAERFHNIGETRFPSRGLAWLDATQKSRSVQSSRDLVRILADGSRAALALLWNCPVALGRNGGPVLRTYLGRFSLSPVGATDRHQTDAAMNSEDKAVDKVLE